VVEDHHFDALFDAYLGDERVRDFMAEHNPAALRETAERFEEARRRGLWRRAEQRGNGVGRGTGRHTGSIVARPSLLRPARPPPAVAHPRAGP
jgi:hypothetical protein